MPPPANPLTPSELIPVTGQADPNSPIPVTGQLSGQGLSTQPSDVAPTLQNLSQFLPQQQQQQPQSAPTLASGSSGAEPAVDIQAASFTPHNGPRQISKIILHSSDGSEKGDINTLTGAEPGHRVSAHYYTTQDGRSLHFVNDNDIAWHAGQTSGPNAAFNNRNTIGIEQEHVDGQPWSDNEVQGTARTVAALLTRHPNLSINDVLGHSDIAPERKQDPLNFPWKQFRGYVQANLANGKPTPGQAVAQLTPQSAADPSSPTWENLSSFLKPKANG
jgi:N-acetyl-anhydromuramyl-L-alanine amidase AmpD